MAETTVYVRLLAEGTEICRPTRALDEGAGLFRLLPPPDYDPEDEKWEFPPNSLVRVERRLSEGETILVAIAP
jgi:hypothetical protein